MAASQTRTRVSSCKPISTKETVAIHYGAPRKSAAQVWQKDLFRFLISPKGSNDFLCPQGQGDIKCLHVYSSQIIIEHILGHLLRSLKMGIIAEKFAYLQKKQ